MTALKREEIQLVEQMPEEQMPYVIQYIHTLKDKAMGTEQVQGYIAFHSLPNIFYILRKSHSETDRREMLKKLCFVLQVTGASHEKVCNAIERNDFSDFEDCLQDECAKEVSADYIITRNVES